MCTDDIIYLMVEMRYKLGVKSGSLKLPFVEMRCSFDLESDPDSLKMSFVKIFPEVGIEWGESVQS